MPALAGLSPRDFRLIRRARGLSLADVAVRIGLDASSLSRIERGERPIPPDLEIRLLRIFFDEATGR